MKLIIATPSPFARKARIALIEKKLEHEVVVLIVTERARPAEKQSAAWIARQAAKIPAGLAELERLLHHGYFTQHGFGLAEISTGCALGYLDLRYPELDWRRAHPNLARLAAGLAMRPSFAATVPKAREIPAQQ